MDTIYYTKIVNLFVLIYKLQLFYDRENLVKWMDKKQQRLIKKEPHR